MRTVGIRCLGPTRAPFHMVLVLHVRGSTNEVEHSFQTLATITRPARTTSESAGRRCRPSRRASASVRSNWRPGSYGPRSTTWVSTVVPWNVMKIRTPHGSVGCATPSVSGRERRRTRWCARKPPGPLEPASATNEPTGCRPGAVLVARLGGHRERDGGREQRQAGERDFAHREVRPHPSRLTRYSWRFARPGSARGPAGTSRNVDRLRLVRAAAAEPPARRRLARAGRGCSARRLARHAPPATASAPAARAAGGRRLRLQAWIVMLDGREHDRSPRLRFRLALLLLGLGRQLDRQRRRVRPLAEHLLPQCSRGDPRRRLVPLCLRIADPDLFEGLGGRQVHVRDVVPRREAAAVVRLAAPRGPFEDRDHEPAEQHHTGDLERVELRQRDGDREPDEEQRLEDEPRAAPISHRASAGGLLREPPGRRALAEPRPASASARRSADPSRSRPSGRRSPGGCRARRPSAR